jgi:hypothetical protein
VRLSVGRASVPGNGRAAAATHGREGDDQRRERLVRGRPCRGLGVGHDAAGILRDVAVDAAIGKGVALQALHLTTPVSPDPVSNSTDAWCRAEARSVPIPDRRPAFERACTEPGFAFATPRLRAS